MGPAVDTRRGRAAHRPQTGSRPIVAGSTQVAAVEVFISYSHRDERYREALVAHLSALKRQGLLVAWHDRRIDPGARWERAINHALERCGIVLLLISADFLNSDYCMGVELKRAMERDAAGTALVIPIVVRPCDWKHSQFGRLQALPKDGRPVTKWGNQDEAWTDVSRGIRRVLSPVRPRAATSSKSTKRAQTAPRSGGGQPAQRAQTPFLDTLLNTFAKEAGKKLANDGIPALIQAAFAGGEASDAHHMVELVEAVLLGADHDRLGKLVREIHPGASPPRKKAERARMVAEAYQWDEELVHAAFKADGLRKLCRKYDLPTGNKTVMARGLVAAVEEVASS